MSKTKPPTSQKLEAPFRALHGWQYLRRNEIYKKACYAEIEKAETARNPFFFQIAKYAFGNATQKVEELKNLKGEDVNLSELMSEAQQVEAFARVVEDLVSQMFGPDPSYLKNFLELYGDVILFPISPQIESPFLLSGFWTFSPVSFFNPIQLAIRRSFQRHAEQFKGLGRIQLMNVGINLTFPKNEILKELEEVLDLLHKKCSENQDVGLLNHEKIGKLRNLTWEDIQFELKAYDLRHEDMSWNEIGKVLSELDPSKACTNPKKLEDLARTAYQRATTRIRYFDRQT